MFATISFKGRRFHFQGFKLFFVFGIHFCQGNSFFIFLFREIFLLVVNYILFLLFRGMFEQSLNLFLFYFVKLFQSFHFFHDRIILVFLFLKYFMMERCLCFITLNQLFFFINFAYQNNLCFNFLFAYRERSYQFLKYDSKP